VGGSRPFAWWRITASTPRQAAGGGPWPDSSVVAVFGFLVIFLAFGARGHRARGHLAFARRSSPAGFFFSPFPLFLDLLFSLALGLYAFFAALHPACGFFFFFPCWRGAGPGLTSDADAAFFLVARYGGLGVPASCSKAVFALAVLYGAAARTDWIQPGSRLVGPRRAIGGFARSRCRLGSARLPSWKHPLMVSPFR